MKYEDNLIFDRFIFMLWV